MSDERFEDQNGFTEGASNGFNGFDELIPPGDRASEDRTSGYAATEDAAAFSEGLAGEAGDPASAGSEARYYNYNENRRYEPGYPGRSAGMSGSGRRNRSEKPGKWIAIVLAVILVFVLGAGAGTYISGRASAAALRSSEESAQSRGGSKVTAEPSEQETGNGGGESDGAGAGSDASSSPKTISRVEDVGSSLGDTTVADVAEKVMPSIVSVYNKYTETGQFFGRTYTQEGEAAGSGIIIEETEGELLIVTNNHVVEGADSLSVQFIDEENCEAALKGTDASSDLAVIAVSLDDLTAETKEKIAIAELGDSDTLRIGEHAIAIGNALGYGQSLTVGYISALNREITSEDGITGTFIQTDAAINPGNSGGALLNAGGQVIGINSNKIGGSAVEGMGFAIPISKALPIINELKLQESRTKVAEEDQGVLGIHGISVTSDIASAYGLQVGAYVEEIVEGSGAAKSELQTGDIITGINGQTITGMQDLQEQLVFYAAGTEVTLTVQHPMEGGSYEEREIKVTLSSREILEEEEGDSRERIQNSHNWDSNEEDDAFGNFFGFPFGF